MKTSIFIATSACLPTENKAQDIITFNVNNFVGAYLERNWDEVSTLDEGEAILRIGMVTEAAIIAAHNEADKNPEAMQGMGRDWF